MSIQKIKRLSMNEHFYSLMLQCFLAGYERPCPVKIACIAADRGLLPQVLIVDHVDGHALANKEEFLKHTRYNWTDGNALI